MVAKITESILYLQSEISPLLIQDIFQYFLLVKCKLIVVKIRFLYLPVKYHSLLLFQKNSLISAAFSLFIALGQHPEIRVKAADPAIQFKSCAILHLVRQSSGEITDGVLPAVLVYTQYSCYLLFII